MKIESLYIEITNRCNLNCIDCYNASGLNSVSNEIDPEILNMIIKIFSEKYKVKNFTLSGGETFIHSHWHRVMDVMERYDSLSFIVVSNGTIKEDRYFKLLENDSRFHIQFSVDGANETIHEYMRGKGSFNKTIDSINKIKAKNTPIIKMVVTKINHMQIDEYYALAVELGCLPVFSFAERLGNAVVNWNRMYLCESEKIAVIKKIEEMNIKYNIKTKPPLAMLKCSLLSDVENCNLCIKPNGNIMPCHNFYDDKFAIGSIYELENIDLEHEMNKFRNIILKRLTIDYGCGRCINKYTCDRGCAASAYMKYEDILASDDDCRLRKLQTAFIPVKDYIKRRGSD